MQSIAASIGKDEYMRRMIARMRGRERAGGSCVAKIAQYITYEQPYACTSVTGTGALLGVQGGFELVCTHG